MTEPLSTTDASEDWVDDVFDAVVSDIQASGYFKTVNQHEPRKKPGRHLTAAVWVQHIGPVPVASYGSGLSSTSAILVFMSRLFSPLQQTPSDMIDPELLKACSNLIRRYHDDFDFGLHPLVRNVDLLGITGFSLSADAAYLEQDGATFRVMDLVIPVILNDVWPQSTSQ